MNESKNVEQRRNGNGEGNEEKEEVSLFSLVYLEHRWTPSKEREEKGRERGTKNIHPPFFFVSLAYFCLTRMPRGSERASACLGPKKPTSTKKKAFPYLWSLGDVGAEVEGTSR